MTFIDKLNDIKACSDAVEWCKDYKTLSQAWAACERGDWMLWLAGKLSGKPGSDKRKPLVLATCECVRLSLKYIPKNKLRPLKAIETAESWANGDPNITPDDITSARIDAYAAVSDGYDNLTPYPRNRAASAPTGAWARSGAWSRAAPTPNCDTRRYCCSAPCWP